MRTAWCLACSIVWGGTTPMVAQAADHEPLVEASPAADAWERRVRRARTATTAGVVLMVPAAGILAVGGGLALQDSDALLVAGLAGGTLGSVASVPLMLGVGQLEHDLRVTGHALSPVPIALVLGTPFISSSLALTALVTGSEEVFAASVAAGGVFIVGSTALGLYRLKQTRTLGDAPPIARRTRLTPTLRPHGPRGMTVGLAGVF